MTAVDDDDDNHQHKHEDDDHSCRPRFRPPRSRHPPPYHHPQRHHHHLPGKDMVVCCDKNTRVMLQLRGQITARRSEYTTCVGL